MEEGNAGLPVSGRGRRELAWGPLLGVLQRAPSSGLSFFLHLPLQQQNRHLLCATHTRLCQAPAWPFLASGPWAGAPAVPCTGKGRRFMWGFTNATQILLIPLFQESGLKEAVTCLYLLGDQAQLQPRFSDTKSHEFPILPFSQQKC